MATAQPLGEAVDIPSVREGWLTLPDRRHTRDLYIDRKKIFEDAVSNYDTDDILSDKLRVEFVGEEGEDFDGLTREFFSVFWETAVKKLCKGHTYYHFEVSPQTIVTPETLHAIGRVLLHGFLLTGYLPLSLDPGLLFYLLTGKEPCEDIIVSGLLKSLSEAADEAITSSLELNDDFNLSQRLRLINFLSQESMEKPPSNSTELRRYLVLLGRYKLFIKSHYFLFHISKFSSNNLTRNVRESEWMKYFDGLKPTGETISENMSVKFGPELSLHMLEQVVYSHVEKYVQNLNAAEAELFMKFLTGCETSTVSVTVIFNSLEGEEAIPNAHICTGNLEVSRFTPSYEWFKNTMDNILRNVHARRGFQYS